MTPVQSASPLINEHEQELRQLRENFTALTVQYAQLDEANRAWQLYHGTQLDSFRHKLHDYFPIEENTSFDDIAQQIVNQITKEKEDSAERNAELERANNDLRSGNLYRLLVRSFLFSICRLNGKYGIYPTIVHEHSQ